MVILENACLRAEISAATGTIVAVTNRLTGLRHVLRDDQAGMGIEPVDGRYVFWRARDGQAQEFSVATDGDEAAVRVSLTTRVEAMTFSILYSLGKTDFWLERKIAVECGAVRLDRLLYGKLEIAPAAEVRLGEQILELGRFDRPRLICANGAGGVFGGVGWWFYSVDENKVSQNCGMNFPVNKRFESEPWYVGVFGVEAGEPYPGWLWYKTFLQQRKLAHDKQPVWSYWNAGWGQWGIDLDDPAAGPYIELIHQLGVRQIAFGSGYSGKGIPEYVRLAREDAVAKRNIQHLQKRGIAFGFLAYGGLKEKWNDRALLEENIQAVKNGAAAGFGAYHFDFFYLVDTFTAHYHGAQYMRAAREHLDYTECHLGMAMYGPQFQREVIVNHPADIGGFDISNFSSDWTSFRAFRHERHAWQTNYKYLMPEYGLYYFLTHYANPHPRLNMGPEPHELFCSYGGQGFNFHDQIGFREVMAAAAAFTPFYIFGHLDLNMPEADIGFARECLDWVRDNIAVIREARVCFEDEDACVVSKIRDGKGAIFLVNYGVAECAFKLDLGLFGRVRLREVYPLRKTAFQQPSGKPLNVTVRGGSVVILDVNGGFKSLPPENPRRFPIKVDGWRSRQGTWSAGFRAPDVRKVLAVKKREIAGQLFSIDRFYADSKWAEHIPQALGIDGEQRKLPMDVKWLQPSPYSILKNIKEVPERFLKIFDFEERPLVATWKFVPWAFADRLWLVWKPVKPPLMSQRAPLVKLNQRSVALVPRVDFRKGPPSGWTCPIFFADISNLCQFGSNNTIAVSRLKAPDPGLWYLVSSA